MITYLLTYVTDSYFEKAKFPIASITIRRERNSWQRHS